MIRMNRRSFLNQLAIAGVLAGAGPLANAAAGKGLRAGVQLFPVRELLRKDAVGAIRALAGIGFRELQMFGFGAPSTFTNDAFFGMAPKAFARLTRQLGMSVPMVHYSGDVSGVAKAAELARQIGCHTFIQPMAPEFLRITPERTHVLPASSLEQMQGIAARLNALGRECRRHGLRFAYHNHHMEFAKFGDRSGFDVLLAETDPTLVYFELDVGWAKSAGVDPAALLLRDKGRYISCHLKDYNPAIPVSEASAAVPIPDQVRMVPPGEGVIDFGQVLAAMRATGIRHGFLEVDIAHPDILDVLRRGYHALQAL